MRPLEGEQSKQLKRNLPLQKQCHLQEKFHCRERVPVAGEVLVLCLHADDLCFVSCRDARIEGKIARREDKRAREASPDVVNLPGGGDAMGLGDADSFQAAQARYSTIQKVAGSTI